MFFLPRALADHPLQEAKKNKWDDYFKKLASSRHSVDDISPKVVRVVLAAPCSLCRMHLRAKPRADAYSASAHCILNPHRTFAPLQNGWTALHFAARNGAPSHVSELIRKGAEVDKRCSKVCNSALLQPCNGLWCPAPRGHSPECEPLPPVRRGRAH